MAVLIYGTNADGTLINCYWDKLLQHERARAKVYIQSMETKQAEDYRKATTPIKPKEVVQEKKKVVNRPKYEQRLALIHGEMVFSMYRQGYSKRAIARNLSISPHSVRNILKELGVEE